MNKFARILPLVAICLLGAVAADPQGVAGYYRQPTVSTDSIVFVAEGDLWRTGLSGGAALRLTSNLAT